MPHMPVLLGNEELWMFIVILMFGWQFIVYGKYWHGQLNNYLFNLHNLSIAQGKELN